MRWVYILKCRHFETNKIYFYIGVTERLYRRFWEHFGGRGGINTSIHIPEYVIGLYKIDILGKFLDYINVINSYKAEKYIYNKLKKFNEIEEDYDYNKYEIETFITECMMMNHSKIWNKIRGGKYIRFDIEYKYPENLKLTKLPICKCGLPCDIKCKDNSYLYFRCCKKNMWNDLEELFYLKKKPCDFYKEFTDDIKIRNEYKNNNDKFINIYKNSINWLKNVPTHESKNCLSDFPAYCICSSENYCDSDESEDEDIIYNLQNGCQNYKDSKMISFNNHKLCLCYDCFIEYNEELKNKFIKKSRYLFIDIE